MNIDELTEFVGNKKANMYMAEYDLRKEEMEWEKYLEEVN